MAVAKAMSQDLPPIVIPKPARTPLEFKYIQTRAFDTPVEKVLAGIQDACRDILDLPNVDMFGNQVLGGNLIRCYGPDRWIQRANEMLIEQQQRDKCLYPKTSAEARSCKEFKKQQEAKDREKAKQTDVTSISDCSAIPNLTTVGNVVFFVRSVGVVSVVRANIGERAVVCSSAGQLTSKSPGISDELYIKVFTAVSDTLFVEALSIDLLTQQ